MNRKMILSAGILGFAWVASTPTFAFSAVKKVQGAAAASLAQSLDKLGLKSTTKNTDRTWAATNFTCQDFSNGKIESCSFENSWEEEGEAGDPDVSKKLSHQWTTVQGHAAHRAYDSLLEIGAAPQGHGPFTTIHYSSVICKSVTAADGGPTSYSCDLTTTGDDDFGQAPCIAHPHTAS